MTMAYNRDALSYAITSLIIEYQKANCPDTGACALNALDALGFAAGQIFALAPDGELRKFSREHFLAAINDGLGGPQTIDKSKVH
jgi:hypothetical protein